MRMVICGWSRISGHYNSAISNLNYMNVELTTLKQIIKI
jgi:hypothetical protein